MPKSTISKIDFKQEITSEKYGKSNIYIVELFDGTKGDFFCNQKNTPPAVGYEIDYEFMPNADEKYSGIIKENKKKIPQNYGGGAKKNEKAENARTALIVAKDLIIAGKSKEGISTKEVANSLFLWLESKSN